MNQELISLEKEGRYVFHGSPYGSIEMLEPRQSRHFPDPSNMDEFILDGEPAVSATPYVDFAIFRALVNSHNLKNQNTRSGFGFKDNKKEFRISNKEALESLKDKNGFVYVFDKKDFEPYSRNGKSHAGNMEWRSYQNVIPIQVIRVYFSDLENILPSIEFTKEDK